MARAAEAQHLSKEAPIDIAFICTKSYDTHWAALFIRQYLAPGGYVVSLQNCMNEETIAGVVGWGKTMGCIASNISVGLVEPGMCIAAASQAARRTPSTAPARCTARSPSGRMRCAGSSPTPTAPKSPTICGASAGRSSSPIRWPTASPRRPGSAARMAQDEAIRHFQARLGSEAIRIGEARGYKLEEIDHLPPGTIARAGGGDPEALRIFDERRLSRAGRGSPDQRPSMGQDMAKGRRTEIEFLNGFVVREGEQVGLQARANARLVDIVKKVERGELQQDPHHITELRLN